VVVVIPYDDEDQAIAIANDSDYGLAGAVWTSDADRGAAIATRIRAGTVGVNTYALDFTIPFGGLKASGFGREYGREGIEEFTEIKSVLGVP